MDTVQQINETILRITGAPAFRTGMSLAGSAATMTGRAISSVVGMLNPLNTLLGGLSFGAAAYEIAHLGSQFENTRRLIAGTFATMGASSDFTHGLTMASHTMDQIAIAAARLPGEAEDYIQVFQSGLPVLLQSMHGPMTEITDFSNRFTAIMSTLGVSSAEAGMMINRALAAGRGGLDQQSMAARRLMPFIEVATASTDHQVHSIAQFNALTQEQRQHVLALTMQQEGLNAMLQDAGNSWDAQTGALSSALQMMTRMGTAPLFEGMRTGLGQINGLLMDSEGHWTTIGNRIIHAGTLISERLVGGLTVFAQGAQHAGIQIGHLLAQGGPIAGAGPGPGVRPMHAAEDPLAAPIAHIAGIFQTLGTVVAPVVELLETLSPILMGMNQIGMSLLGALDTLLSPVALLFNGIVSIATSIFETLAPGLESLWEGVSSLVTGISDFLNPILRILVIGLIAVVDVVQEYLMPVINAWIDMLGVAIDVLGQFLSWLGDQIGQVADIEGHQAALGTEPRTGLGGVLEGMLAALDEGNAQTETQAAAERAAARAATPAARGGSHTHQDFRYSRFDISQRFQEGFDPDRVAVAFADDLGRVGERRLQSSQAPLFSVR